jgi:hypothetical protein
MTSKTLLLLVGPLVAATAMDRGPLYLAAGFDYLTKPSRDLTSDRALHLAGGFGEAQQALFGAPSLDFDWGHATGHGNAIDTYGVTYCERAVLSDSLYFGLGVGSFFSRVKVQDEQGDTNVTQRWLPGARGMLGMMFDASLFVEATYFYSGKVNGVNTNAVALCVGAWF